MCNKIYLLNSFLTSKYNFISNLMSTERKWMSRESENERMKKEHTAQSMHTRESYMVILRYPHMDSSIRNIEYNTHLFMLIFFVRVGLPTLLLLLNTQSIGGIFRWWNINSSAALHTIGIRQQKTHLLLLFFTRIQTRNDFNIKKFKGWGGPGAESEWVGKGSISNTSWLNLNTDKRISKGKKTTFTHDINARIEWCKSWIGNRLWQSNSGAEWVKSHMQWQKMNMTIATAGKMMRHTCKRQKNRK